MRISDQRRRAVAYFALNIESPHFRSILALLVGVVAAIIANAVAQVRLNVWQGSFYDALGRRDYDLFQTELWNFLIIVAFLVAIGAAQTRFNERLKVTLRQALTGDLLDHWLKPKRAYRLSLMGEIGANPDQRLQEDARHLCELQADLMVGFIQSSLLLFSFVGVLWVLSDRVVFTMHGEPFTIPGYMVWASLIYALVGSGLAWWRGRPLIRLNTRHYAYEAELRYGLVRVVENAEGVALYAGEPAERRRLDGLLDDVLGVSRQLANRLADLFWVTSTYGYLVIVAPILLAAPGYFGSSLSFGALMMVVGAFQQVQGALRWFVDNLSRIADYQATFMRIMSFREAVIDLDRLAREPGRIDLVETEEPMLMIDDLEIRMAEGVASLQERHVEIRPGDRVQVAGDPGSGKSALFHVLAGLIGAGSGRIGLPGPNARWMCLQQRPYLSLGTLADVLSYPSSAGSFDEPALRAALKSVGLARLAGSDLGAVKRWDRELTPGEQQCLAFARLLLQKPGWVLLDGALDTLDGRTRQCVLSIFDHELADAALISIGEAVALDDSCFERTLHLTRAGLPAGGTPADLPKELVQPW